MGLRNITRTFGRNPIMNVDKDKLKNIMKNKVDKDTQMNNPIFYNMCNKMNQCLGKNKK
jgi:hypothetical protein